MPLFLPILLVEAKVEVMLRLEWHISWFFNFLPVNGKNDRFPGWEKPGKPGNFCTETKISQLFGYFFEIMKSVQYANFDLHLHRVQISAKFLPYFKQFSRKLEQYELNTKDSKEIIKDFLDKEKGL